MADYDEAAQMSIITVLAEEAGVSTSAITLRIISGSVVVTFIIFVDSQARADNMASTLATGVMASPATFEAALVNGFQRASLSTSYLSVVGIIEAPTASIPPASNDDGLGVNHLVGIIVGSITISIMCCLIVIYRKQKHSKVRVVAHP